MCNGTVTVPILTPNSQFENRLTQLDLRLTKNINMGHARAQVNFDAYNVFNANTVLVRNNTFGATRGRPTVILAARISTAVSLMNWN